MKPRLALATLFIAAALSPAAAATAEAELARPAGKLLGDLDRLATFAETGVLDEPTAQVEVDVRLDGTFEASLAAVRPLALSVGPASTAEARVRLRVLVLRLRELSRLPAVIAVGRAPEPGVPPAPH